MWTVLDWANPGCVGTKRQWEGFVARPLTRGQSKTATTEEHVNSTVSLRTYRGTPSAIFDVDASIAGGCENFER